MVEHHEVELIAADGSSGRDARDRSLASGVVLAHDARGFAAATSSSSDRTCRSTTPAFDHTRPGGFLNTQLFSLLLPLLLGAFAIGYGASTIAGEQHKGVTRMVVDRDAQFAPGSTTAGASNVPP